MCIITETVTDVQKEMTNAVRIFFISIYIPPYSPSAPRMSARIIDEAAETPISIAQILPRETGSSPTNLPV